MKLGGTIFGKWNDAGEWAALAQKQGYSAVTFPVDYRADIKDIDAYRQAANEAGLVIAEVGVWNNTLDPDPGKREEAISKAVHQLELADYVGARCCVNVAGSVGEQWDGPHPDNLTERTFEAIVLTTQKIIDRVKPKQSAYSLEPMPWMYPHTPDSYVALIEAIGRKGFKAHLDPVNTITSLDLYYNNGAMINEWFDKLGDQIVSCHAKDTILGSTLTLHIDECRPGEGNLDYRTYLRRVSELDDDVCVILEHMTEEEDYRLGREYLNRVASELGFKF